MGELAGNKQEVPLRKKKHSVPVILGTVLLTGVLWFFGNHIWQMVSIRLVDIRSFEEDVLVKKIPAVAVLLKNEIPVRAPLTGNIEMLARDGERVRPGSPIARIKGINNSITVYSPRAGLLCTHVDGLEGVLKPENTGMLDMKTIKKIETSSKQQVEMTKKAEKGVPFCKLVDNLEPLAMYLRLEGEKNIDVERLGRREKLNLLWEGERFSGRLIEPRNGELLLEVSHYPDKILHFRQVNIHVIVEEIKGYPVPQEALVFKENQAGMYVVKKQFVDWVPVTIQGYIGGKIVIQGDRIITQNMRYIANPGRVKQGDRVEW